MPTNRLRLRLTAGFAFAFGVGLAILAAAALGYLNRESRRRLDGKLDAINRAAFLRIERELRDTPDSSLAFVAREVTAEWPRNDDAFLLVDEHDAFLAAIDVDSASQRILRTYRRQHAPRFDVDGNGPDYQAAAVSRDIVLSQARTQRLTVIAFASTEGIESDTQLLGIVLAIVSPLIVLVSLLVGYVLARRALLPVTSLADAISAIAPSDLSQRLRVTAPRDEVSALAEEFNALLTRLEEAQHRNRGFVREAAHQIRTPLTLVLGEAAYELTSVPSVDRMHATLGRIRTAAEQMRRRVDELFLLAEARTGEAVRLEDDVELDSLVLECTDLMRARATALGRSLAIGNAEPVVIRGNAALMQEALLELLENACRHGTNDAPVTVSCYRETTRCVLDVSSAGAPFALPAESPARDATGLGLSIVRWVATAHHGTLSIIRDHTNNTVRLTFPVR